MLLLLHLQVVETLTADSTADILAVALHLATAAHLDRDGQIPDGRLQCALGGWC
jgi:hypothetical protein